MSMHDASGAATPTDAEREIARELANIYRTSEATAAIAQALADQRAKYEDLADWYAEIGARTDLTETHRAVCAAVAKNIRQVPDA